MNRRRSGVTMLELAVYVAVTGIAIEVAIEAAIVLLRGQRDGRAVPAAQVDRVCDRLRQELTAGGRIEGDALIVPGHRYTHAANALQRDGVAVLESCAASWRSDGAALVVELRWAGRPARTIRVTVAP